ncbi:MAG TPA: hypothetical protein VJ930_00010 [Acidimicrobiia bacterium]|nr:hypothetical protein [Acidimicrobiia bacterium]
MAGLRTAAILHWFLGLGFGIPGVFGIRHLAAGRGILYFMGFPTYGKGPFERVGIQTTVPLLSAFVLLCLLECVAGWLLWSGARSGAILSFALLALGAAFWWGFALPIPPILAVAATAVVVANWGFLV